MTHDLRIARMEHLRDVEGAILNLLEVINADTITPPDGDAHGAVSVLHSAAIGAEVSVRRARRLAEGLLSDNVHVLGERLDRAMEKGMDDAAS
jgi:hypothetical protein